jgi:bacillithiol synthase
MMETIPLRSLYRGTSLLADYWEGAEGIRSLLPGHFLDPGACQAQARALGGRSYPRGTLCTVLGAQNASLGAGPATAANIGRLADPRSVAVLGGQQAGLFGGPLYTLHKALTILALADHLGRELGVPVVPVFWIASEDSDVAEVDHAYLTDSGGRLLRVCLPSDRSARLPVWRVPLGPAVIPALGRVRSALPRGGYSPEVLEALARAYRPEAAYPEAFGRWLHHVLEGRGIVTVDPSDPRLKREAATLFAREITEKSLVTRAVLQAMPRMTALGYKPQVEAREGLLTLFHQDPARESIAVDGRGFLLKEANRRVSLEEMLALAEEHPEKLGPNALMRPLYQDTLFPTAAVVLGPAELAYWAQLPGAYREAGIPMPILFPRASLTLVDPRIGRLMDRLGLSLQQVATQGGRIIGELARRNAPPQLLSRLEEGRAAAAAFWAELGREMMGFEQTLGRTTENAARAVEGRFRFMEKKMIKAAQRKDGELRGRVDRIVDALHPREGLQERTLCALPFLASHGPQAVEEAARGVALFTPGHRGVWLPA